VIIHGDCREVLRTLDADSFDACVTDPPYHLTQASRGGHARTNNPASPHGRHRIGDKGFMGHAWDGGDVAFQPEMWAAVLRVMKPGAYLLAFGGTRTYHRLACAIEDAGFELRDMIAWVYSSGFPKGTDKAKIPADWQGWNTALKPALEPIVLARKPMVGTLAENLQQWGTGALNVDGCRIEATGRPLRISRSDPSVNTFGDGLNGSRAAGTTDSGRWPANVIHDGSDEVLAVFPQAPGQLAAARTEGDKTGNVYGSMNYGPEHTPRGDTGSAARFFYCSKASRSDRGEGNTHSTVKPTALMRYLCRLVTPPGGTVLDPFAGSGSTLKAAALEGFKAVGIEREAEYVEIARRRLVPAGFEDLFV
jgi:site-specific DNA-methyltransferase (adenine-specific)